MDLQVCLSCLCAMHTSSIFVKATRVLHRSDRISAIHYIRAAMLLGYATTGVSSSPGLK